MDAAVRAARRAGRQPRVVVVTLPDNPTGRLASEGSVKALCEAARDLDLVIVADEIYRDLVFDDVAFPSPAAWAPERTVTTTALSKNYALGGWRVGAARFPASPLGARLRESVRGIASEIWSSTPMPMQHAAAYAWSDPRELVDRVAAARRLHGAVANAVAEVFAGVGCEVMPPQGGFYVWPDFSPLREALAERWGVGGSGDIARVLMDEFGVAVIQGDAFGDDPAALTVRVAVTGIYGDSDSERLAALVSERPLEMPWIADALESLRGKLTAFTAVD
jgi:aspartate aminotransferase